MVKRKREEIEWASHGNYLITSLIVWNDLYKPFQVIVFRSKVMIRVYIKIKDFIYREDFLLNTLFDNEDKNLFFITNKVQKLVNYYSINYQGNHVKETSIEDFDSKVYQEIFLEDIVIESLEQESPDYGFYSLALNFHKIKSMIEKGEKPSLYDEFTRINNLYHK